MASVIKGIPVVLYEHVQTGVDAFNRPILEDVATTIENVLVTPASSTDIVDTTNLSEDKIVYNLCIPKGDSHNWRNAKVEFFGQIWQTVGDTVEYIEAMTPLDWNRKVTVERYE